MSLENETSKSSSDIEQEISQLNEILKRGISSIEKQLRNDPVFADIMWAFNCLAMLNDISIERLSRSLRRYTRQAFF